MFFSNQTFFIHTNVKHKIINKINGTVVINSKILEHTEISNVRHEQIIYIYNIDYPQLKYLPQSTKNYLRY